MDSLELGYFTVSSSFSCLLGEGVPGEARGGVPHYLCGPLEGPQTKDSGGRQSQQKGARKLPGAEQLCSQGWDPHVPSSSFFLPSCPPPHTVPSGPLWPSCLASPTLTTGAEEDKQRKTAKGWTVRGRTGKLCGWQRYAEEERWCQGGGAGGWEAGGGSPVPSAPGSPALPTRTSVLSPRQPLQVIGPCHSHPQMGKRSGGPTSPRQPEEGHQQEEGGTCLRMTATGASDRGTFADQPAPQTSASHPTAASGSLTGSFTRGPSAAPSPGGGPSAPRRAPAGLSTPSCPRATPTRW